MLPVSTTRQHAPTPPQPSPFRRWPCAWEQKSSTWRHRSGLGAQNWILTQPSGSKSGALRKHWVQHQETQNSCPLSTRTRQCQGVGRNRPRLPGGSLGAGRYRSGTARNKCNIIDSLLWSVRRNPGEICPADHRFHNFFLVDHVNK